MEEIKQELKICIGANVPLLSLQKTLIDAYSIEAQSNNYASSYAIPSFKNHTLKKYEANGVLLGALPPIVEAKGGFNGTLVPIPIGTPRTIEKKGHNGPHQSHISKK